MKIITIFIYLGICVAMVASSTSDVFTTLLTKKLGDIAARGTAKDLERELRGAGPDICKGADGVTLIMWSVWNRNRDTFFYLLANGADLKARLVNSPEVVNKKYAGCTVLQLAAMEADEWYLEMLLEHGADPNEGNDYTKQTVLLSSIGFYAESDSTMDKVRCLVKHGADVNKRGTEFNISAMEQAAQINRYDVVWLLMGNKDLIVNKEFLNVYSRTRTDPKGKMWHWRKMVGDYLKKHGYAFDDAWGREVESMGLN